MASSGQGGFNPNVPDYAQQERDRKAAIESLVEMSKQMEGMSDRTRDAGKFANSLNLAMFGLNSAMHGLSTVSNLAHLALDGFGNAVQAVVGRVGGLVNLVNPGVMDRFNRSFSAFQAQMGTVFLPLLTGLTGLVQGVGNALAGLSPQGKSFLLFLAGAGVGLTAAVVAGGTFLAILGSLAGALSAGAVAGEAFGLGLDAATAGLAAVGAVIGTALTALTGAAAGGVGALALSGGGLQSITQQLAPFFQALTGVLESAAVSVMPQVTLALERVMPPLVRLFTALVQYLPLVAEVVGVWAAEMLPVLVKHSAELTEAMLPLAVQMTKLTVAVIPATAALADLILTLVNLSPLIKLLTGGRRAAPAGQPGNAPAPVTGANYTTIEELYRKSQQEALLGMGAKQETTKEVLQDPGVIQQWAAALATEIVKAIHGNQAQQARQFAVGVAAAAARAAAGG